MKWKSTIKVAYQPEFSYSFMNLIKDNVSPEMSGDNTSLYSISLILDIEDLESVSMKDNEVLSELEKNDIEYVEF